jgi:phospholipid N-methyltransferase
MSFIERIKNLGILVFYREMFKHPAQVGAVHPSSQKLAKQLALQVPKRTSGLIVELGAGTGVVTKALLHRGVSEQQLVLIEDSASMVDFLQTQFPRLRVIHGDAENLSQILGESTKVACVVSSLPFRSLSEEKAKKIFDQIETVLGSNGKLILYTYSAHKTHFSTQLKLIYSKWILMNIPPARIEVFQFSEKNSHAAPT